MRRPAALALVAALVMATAAACTSGGDETERPADPEGPSGGGAGPEAVDLRTVPLPEGLARVRFPAWSADGERILFSAVPEGGTRGEVMSVAEDGSDLRCLSCGVAPDMSDALLKPLAFADGERIAVRVGEQSPIRPADHAVLECAPSTADCHTARLVPIEAPSADDPALTQDQRELRLAPDGEMVGLSQVWRRADGTNGLIAVVGRLARAADGQTYRVERSRVVSTLGELKNFTPDGTGVLVAAFTTLPERIADPDVVRVDLATGEWSRVTEDGDYDEDVSLSPDGEWYVVASGRGSGLFETVSQVRRPDFLGAGLDPLTAYLFAHHRSDLLEPWLVRVGAEAEGERGQQLNPDSVAEGFDGRTLVTWHPAGDRVLFWEGKDDPFAPPITSRIVVAHLTDRTPAEPEAPDASPVPSWAPELAGFDLPALPVLESRDGDVTGHVTVTRTPGPGDGQTTVTVAYEGFADEAGWVLDGTEATTRDPGDLAATVYTADLTLSGDHDGYLRADATISAGAINGTITSEVDGHALGLPVAR